MGFQFKLIFVSKMENNAILNVPLCDSDHILFVLIFFVNRINKIANQLHFQSWYRQTGKKKVLEEGG